jgi:hypothetical protein
MAYVGKKPVDVIDLTKSNSFDVTTSATVGGDLTVDTSTLVVDSTNNRVGVGETTPPTKLSLGSTVGASAVDITNHIGLFGNSYGFGITANQLNYVSGYEHVFHNYTGGEKIRMLNGGGITFNGDTAAANALDDYEEGTWTATLSHISGSDPSSAVTATGTYTKIGDLVHIRVQMNNFNSTGASGAISITGLPYSGNVTVTASGDVMFHNSADHADNVVNVAVYVNNATIQFYQSVQDSGWSLVQHNAGSGRYLYFSATYKTTG